jgi:DNA repair protein RadD
MELREYQQDCVNALWDSLCKDKGSHPLAVLPTGAGKSLIIAALIKKSLTIPNTKLIVIAHRKELLEQNFEKMQALTQLPYTKIGMYCASLNKKSIKDVTFTSIQSAGRCPDKFGKQNLVLIDEAHLVPFKEMTTYRKFLNTIFSINPNARCVGFTATPYRTTSGLLTEGENALFTDVAYEIDIKQLIEQGYLSPLVSKRAMQGEIDTSKIRISKGEFLSEDVESRLGDVLPLAIPKILEAGQSRKSWLVFLPNVNSALTVTNILKSNGVSVECVHGGLSHNERSHIIHNYKTGVLRAICSVDVLTTGFDAPSTDLIALLRPTKSPGLYCQLVGRGSRLAPFKKDCLILDFGGNIERFGPIDILQHTKKTSDKKNNKAPCKFCPECGLANYINAATCKECNYSFPAPQKFKELTENASSLSIISEPEEWDLQFVQYKKHIKQGSIAPVVILTAFEKSTEHQLGRKATKVLCFEHENVARQIALNWWVKNVSKEKHCLPNNCDEAINLIQELWEQPCKALVVQNNKYYNVKDFQYQGR